MINTDSWDTVESFDDIAKYKGKMIEWLICDFVKDKSGYFRGTYGKGYLPFDSKPQYHFHSLDKDDYCWFIESSISIEGVHHNAGITVEEFRRYPIRKIRVLSDEEAAKIKLSYGYKNPFAKT